MATGGAVDKKTHWLDSTSILPSCPGMAEDQWKACTAPLIEVSLTSKRGRRASHLRKWYPMPVPLSRVWLWVLQCAQ